jgi:hypothetical protein
MATRLAPDSEGSWRENFATRLDESELRKGLPLSRYVAIGLLVCGISGSALFYFLTHYGTLHGPKGFMISSSRQAAAQEYTAPPSDPDLPAPTGNDDARDSIADLASPLAPDSSRTAAPDEPAGTPPDKHQYKMASLTPPPGTSRLDTAIPSTGYAPVANEKPAAANGKSERGAAVPDVQLVSLTPAQESAMLARASELMSQNDIAGARLVYEYLADQGSSAGAFALAESYDARKLGRYRVMGMTPDARLAEAWYQRAAALGSKEAAANLGGHKR